jgi:hypothetical protein
VVQADVNTNDYITYINTGAHPTNLTAGTHTLSITNVPEPTGVEFAFFPTPAEAGEHDHVSVQSIRFVGSGTPPTGGQTT